MPSFAYLGMAQILKKRAFTPLDDVSLARFNNLGLRGEYVSFSPDGRHFLALTETGVPEKDAPEDTIWLFETARAQAAILDPSGLKTAPPRPLVTMLSDKDGPVIRQVRWLSDASGITFLASRTTSKYRFNQLFTAKLIGKQIRSLTPVDQNVVDYDYRDGNYVYEVGKSSLLNSQVDKRAVAAPMSGNGLYDILFPEDPPSKNEGLWAKVGGRCFQVKDPVTREPLKGNSELSLSPDGRQVVVLAKAAKVPSYWSKYKLPPGYEKFQNLQEASKNPVAYHLIDLSSGKRTLLVDAPSGDTLGWNSHFLKAQWKKDKLLLPNIFLPLDVKDPDTLSEREAPPCIAVLQLADMRLDCLLPLKAGLDKARYAVKDARFLDTQRVVIDFDRSFFQPGGSPAAVYERNATSWVQIGIQDPDASKLPILVTETEDIGHPPILAGKNKTGGVERTVWDPNPQLAAIALGQSEVLQLKDESGFEFRAGLVKPPDYVPGHRYPLVIQTHGFAPHEFLSNGIFASGSAARALAAQGILVLQMDWNGDVFVSPEEAAVEVRVLQGAIKALDDRGLIDPSRVGAIGFSRTVYHVLAYLTTGSPRLAAAAITDGITGGYYEYLSSVDSVPTSNTEMQVIYGGTPFKSTALSNWLAKSPEFNMDHVSSPVLLVSFGKEALLSDWGPYATLRALKKPADLILMRNGTHVITNPNDRLASENIYVDWFRFWLKGEEDPDPAKADQYKRWRELRKPVEQSNAKPKDQSVN